MTRHVSSRTVLAVVGAAVLLIGVAHAQNPPPPEKKSSYAPVDIKEDFASIMARMSAAKAGVMRRQMDLLAQRYDLSNRAAPDAKMFRGKAVQEACVSARRGDDLGAADRARARPGPRPRRLPGRLQALLHPNHPEAG